MTRLYVVQREDTFHPEEAEDANAEGGLDEEEGKERSVLEENVGAPEEEAGAAEPMGEAEEEEEEGVRLKSEMSFEIASDIVLREKSISIK